MLYNRTKNIIIAKESYVLVKPWEQTLGLMFQSATSCKGKGYIFLLPKESKQQVHTFFMRFPLGLAFLDSKKQVIEEARLSPWQTYTPRRPWKWLIELDIDTWNKISLGDIIEF